MTTIDASYYLENVLPQVSTQQRETFFTQYPHIQFDSGQSLQTVPIVMLVALTGTGKSTTLNLLSEMIPIDDKKIPSRRALADMVIIPTAQTIAGDSVQAVTDRVERFRYTGLFARHISGGYVEAYHWLNLTHTTGDTLICEGIRGHREIDYALNHCPNWRIIELSANPLTRLQRLSQRSDAFDEAEGSVSLDFLPEHYRDRVQAELKHGTVSPQAITIMQAEAQNYGLIPYNTSHPNYKLIVTDNLSPDSVAQQVKEAIIAWQA